MSRVINRNVWQVHFLDVHLHVSLCLNNGNIFVGNGLCTLYLSHHYLIFHYCPGFRCLSVLHIMIAVIQFHCLIYKNNSFLLNFSACTLM